MRILTPLAALALAGCDPYDFDPDRYDSLGSPLWDAVHPVATDDALYVALPRSGGAARLLPDGTSAPIDLGEARVQGLASGPGGLVLAIAVGVRCDTLEPVDGDRVVDCPDEDRVDVGVLEVVAPTDRALRLEVDPGYRDFTFSADGRFAVAPLDPTVEARGRGLVSLDSVLVVDLDAGTARALSVGFEARRVLFLGDDTATTGMIVLSQGEVARVDLTGDLPVRGTVYPLTLDAGADVEPLDVALTPDDAFAMITIAGSSDLYVLDLVDPSINIVGLSGQPSDLVVDAAHDRTIVTYGNRARIDLIDHALFDVTSLETGTTLDRIALGADHAVAWSTQGRQDVVRLDLDTLRVDTVRLQFPPFAVHPAPDLTFAVALADALGQPALEIVDLREVDGRVDRDSRPFGLEGRPLSVAFSGSDDGTEILLLQRDVDQLFAMSWPSLATTARPLAAPPVALGTLGDGTFHVTHDTALGLVSFLDGDAVTTVGGFAADGLFDVPRLLPTPEEE